MATDAKSYAGRVIGGYSGILKRLGEKYAASVSRIDREHDMIDKKIESEAFDERNSADAANRIALKNTKAELLGLGLSHSGESVQSNIESNLERSRAFSDIAKNSAKRKAENENARAEAKTRAEIDYLGSVSGVEEKRIDTYLGQANADRAYEAERDDESYRRWAETRDYEAERDDEKHRRWEDSRDYEAEREDEKHRRWEDSRDYEAEREDERYDRYADARDYEAERDDEKHKRYTESRENEVITGEAAAEEPEEDEGIVPKISPKDFVEEIKLRSYEISYPSETQRLSAIRAAVDEVINDTALSVAYRYEVKIFAKAMGLY